MSCAYIWDVIRQRRYLIFIRAHTWTWIELDLVRTRVLAVVLMRQLLSNTIQQVQHVEFGLVTWLRPCGDWCNVSTNCWYHITSQVVVAVMLLYETAVCSSLRFTEWPSLMRAEGVFRFALVALTYLARFGVKSSITSVAGAAGCDSIVQLVTIARPLCWARNRRHFDPGRTTSLCNCINVHLHAALTAADNVCEQVMNKMILWFYL